VEKIIPTLNIHDQKPKKKGLDLSVKTENHRVVFTAAASSITKALLKKKQR